MEQNSETQKTQILKAFGTTVRQLRHERGLKQDALAHKAGVDRTYMTEVEGGKRNLSLEKSWLIIQALEISHEHFFQIMREKNMKD